MKLAVVGARGIVGNEVVKIAFEHGMSFDDVLLVTSDTSGVGCNYVNVLGSDQVVIGLEDALDAKPEFAIFASDDGVSRVWAPRFAERGVVVIDNSSAWRMDPCCKLIVPEVNGELLTGDEGIIASPNCCVIQLVVAVAPLHRVYGIERMVISTYQSVSGGGRGMMEQLASEREGRVVQGCTYGRRIDLNIVPQVGSFLDGGETVEELKISEETKKILCDGSIGISSTSVRVPTIIGHGLSVNLQLKNRFELKGVRDILLNASGVVLCKDDLDYQTPYYVSGSDEVFVGRIRRDNSIENGLNMWIVADNVRRGAATNVLRILDVLSRARGMVNVHE
jgi:aspartate-semialdehyde dehydrogenase